MPFRPLKNQPLPNQPIVQSTGFKPLAEQPKDLGIGGKIAETFGFDASIGLKERYQVAKEKVIKDVISIARGANKVANFLGLGPLQETAALGMIRISPRFRSLKKRVDSGNANIGDYAEYATILEQVPSAKAIAGSTIQLGALLAPTPVGKVSLKGVTTGTKAFIKGFKTLAPRGAAIGGALGFGKALETDKGVKGIVGDTAIGTITGGIINGLLGGLFTRFQYSADKTAQKLRDNAIKQYKSALGATKEKFKNKVDRIVPELLEKQRKGTFSNLRKSALKNIALTNKQYQQLGELQGLTEVTDIENLINREIAKYSSPTGRVFSVNQKKVNTLMGLLDDIKSLKGAKSQDIIQSFQHNLVMQVDVGAKNVAKKIRKIDLSKTDNIDDAVRLIKQSLTQRELRNPAVNMAINNWAKSSKMIQAESVNLVPQQSLRELAQQYADDIYESRKALKTIKDSKVLGQVRKVDSGIRKLLNNRNPDYAAINEIYNLNQNLLDVLDETAQRTGGRKFWSLLRSEFFQTGSIVGGLVGLGTGGGFGAASGGVVGGLTMMGIGQTMNSTWFNTLSAVQKTKLANQLAKIPAQNMPRLLNFLNKLGIKAVLEFIDEGEPPEEIF